MSEPRTFEVRRDKPEVEALVDRVRDCPWPSPPLNSTPGVAPSPAPASATTFADLSEPMTSAVSPSAFAPLRLISC